MKLTETDFQAWMGGVQARMETALARLLPNAQVAPARLHEAMRYAVLEGRCSPSLQASCPKRRARGWRSPLPRWS
jgi:hypothetical protein